jgi:hypothetical protein
VPAATVAENTTFFGLAEEPLRDVFDLNLLGTALPSQVFGEAMTRGQGPEAEGSIVNVSSMAAQKPLTRVAGYSAAKAALENFTRWLAVEVAQKHGPGLRVNAIAPGFFLGAQNWALLMNEDGSLTKLGQAIIEHTGGALRAAGGVSGYLDLVVLVGCTLRDGRSRASRCRLRCVQRSLGVRNLGWSGVLALLPAFAGKVSEPPRTRTWNLETLGGFGRSFLSCLAHLRFLPYGV